MGSVFLESEQYETTNQSDYGEYSGHIEKEKDDLFSKLYIFPNEIANGVTVNQYYYYCDNASLDNSYKIYLECTYSQNDFAKEAERLSKLQTEYNGETKNIIVANNGFHFPAYVAVYEEKLNTYEYALVDEENSKIIYIYAQICGLDKEIIDNIYLPVDFKVPSELEDKGWEGFNLYYFRISNGERDMVE